MLQNFHLGQVANPGSIVGDADCCPKKARRGLAWVEQDEHRRQVGERITIASQLLIL